MLPYPSGDLHVGHWYPMTPSDTRARFMRMNGYRVFFPIGFDAFGLPAENAAITRGIQPREDRKRTRLNSSHANISYAVFCLKKKLLRTDPVRLTRSSH